MVEIMTTDTNDNPMTVTCIFVLEAFIFSPITSRLYDANVIQQALFSCWILQKQLSLPVEISLFIISYIVDRKSVV